MLTAPGLLVQNLRCAPRKPNLSSGIYLDVAPQIEGELVEAKVG